MYTLPVRFAPRLTLLRHAVAHRNSTAAESLDLIWNECFATYSPWKPGARRGRLQLEAGGQRAGSRRQMGTGGCGPGGR